MSRVAAFISELCGVPVYLGDGLLDRVHIILLLGEVHGVLVVSRRGTSLLYWILPNLNI